ncbi:MAG: MFS transporter [Dehalococcoidales bacterium]|nr:MFS transporter [Dehalococcoidales bacterium]
MVRKPRFFYGWYLVGITVASMMLVYGVRNSFSVLFSPILDDFGWYRGSTAIMLSLNILIYGLSAPLAGLLIDRWKPRAVAILGILLLTLATALCYFAGELWHFYLLFGILAPIGTAFCGAPVLSPSLMNWFGKRRGLAISLGQIGGGLSFAYGMLVDAVVSQWGWRPSFLVTAAIVLAVLLPIYLLFFYYRPEDRGMQAYRADESSPAEKAGEVIDAARDWTLRTAFRTYNLWLLVLSQFCYWGVGNYLVLAHQIKFAQDVGYSSMLATSVFALFGIASIGGQICASVSDSIGREKTVTVAVVLAIGALVALMSVKDTSQPWLLYVYAVSSGFATGIFSPNVFAGMGDIFHGRNIGAITALLLTGTGVGGAIGPWLGGYIYDVTQSYNIAFIISMAAFAVAGISFWIAAPRNADKIRAKMQSVTASG